MHNAVSGGLYKRCSKLNATNRITRPGSSQPAAAGLAQALAAAGNVRSKNMRIFTLGLGIIIGHAFIKQFYMYFAQLFVGPKIDHPYQVVMLTSELSIIIGMLLAAWLVNKHNVIKRLADNPAEFFPIKLGVSLFLATWVLYLTTRLIPFSAFIFTGFEPIRLIITQYKQLVYSVANIFIGYGLFISLLSANHESS